MNDITLSHGNTLRLGGVSIRFQRTLRIPDDGTRYPLPPGLGTFPLRRVADYASRVPTEWRSKGGVMLPMYQREAMWMRFTGSPHALKIAAGKVCAISGERWSEGLRRKPQNYVVTGRQPWLDGIATGRGTIRQFVAMPLGLGYTVEGQVTGEETHGGIQLQVYAPKPGRIVERPVRRRARMACAPAPASSAASASAAGAPASGAMGLAAGGRMKQKVYPDPHGIDTWDRGSSSRVFVHVVSSAMWREITGEEPPTTPVTAKSYADAGLPWFDLYDEGAPTVDPTSTLRRVSSVKEIDATMSALPLQDDAPVATSDVHVLEHTLGGIVGVQDGEW